MLDEKQIPYLGSKISKYEPWYNDNVDFNTNSKSYYDYLARWNQYIKLLTETVNQLSDNDEIKTQQIENINQKLVSLQSQIDALPINQIQANIYQIENTLSALQNLVNTLTKNNIDLSSANSNGYLSLPVYNNENDFQGTHPSVIYFPNGFNGKKWWLAFTPYENSNENLENPSVVCSNDLINWSVPAGGSNPLATTPNADNMHYSDTHLIYVDNRLECWYRQSYRGANPLKEQIIRRTTIDGKTWTTEEILYTRDATMKEILCPTVIYDNGNYCIWTVNAQNNVFEYFETPTGKNWVKIREIPFPADPLNSQFKPWHIDIKKNGSIYEMYYQSGINDIGGKMSYATSTDNIIYTWQLDIMKNRPNNFDSYRIYRPSFIDVNNTRYLFYGGSDLAGKWYIGLTTSLTNDLEKFYGADLTHQGTNFSSLRAGRFSHLTETETRSEIKLVVPGFSDIRIVNDKNKPNVIQFKEGLEGTEPYAKTLAYKYSFWDATNNNDLKYLIVDGGVLKYYDGVYEQHVSIIMSGGSTERPTNKLTGQMFFDLTLGKPIFWNSWTWVDANGNQV